MRVLGGCSEGGCPASSGLVRIRLPRSCSWSSIRSFTDTYTIWIHDCGKCAEKMDFRYGNHPVLGVSEFRAISLEFTNFVLTLDYLCMSLPARVLHVFNRST